MAEPLKNLYTPQLLQTLAEQLHSQHPPFNPKHFFETVFDDQWPALELKQRMRHITHSIHKHLSIPYVQQIEVLSAIAHNFSGFTAILFPDFVEVYGLEHPDISIPALEYFTQFSSSEFAVRPFIVKYEKRMIQQHLKWAKHTNHHVRRLASEGIRPRLPWAMALPAFKKDPTPLLPILELLNQDESEYVRKSVANNLNDISKDHPQTVLQIVKNWQGLSKQTDWIVKHASRGLLKQGHTEALSAFGLNPKLKVSVSDFKLSKQKLNIGDSFTFEFKVQLLEKKAQPIRLEYRIYFMKSNGKPSGKIFQIGTYDISPQQKLPFKKSHSFEERTTRKHYPGKHRITLVVNGSEQAELDFILK